MPHSTVIKKYRILDYSKLSVHDLFIKFKYFIDKQHSSMDKKVNTNYLKEQFSISLNLYCIMEELFSRYPNLKNSMDFEFELEEIIRKNSINASKN